MVTAKRMQSEHSSFRVGTAKYRRVCNAVCCLTVLFASVSLHAQDNPGRIESLNSAFDQLIDKNARIENITGDFVGRVTEGPLWSPRGFLIFSDIYEDKVYRWNPNGKLEVFRDPGQFPNGNTYDQQGRLVMAEQKLRRLIRIEKDGKLTVLADQWQGKKLNCPNDVVVRKDGTIYFTDPWWSFPPGAVQELDFQAVWRITPDGKISPESKDFGLPNGIGLSPDEKTLYIGDSRRAMLYALDVAPDGSLSNQRLLTDLKSTEKGAVDGMKLDEQGNIWTTGPGGVWIIDKTGAHIGTIRLPGATNLKISTFPPTMQDFANVPANVGWGGHDYKTLYMTAPQSVFRVQTKVRGKTTYSLK
jgi:sugar lactone lactonase YvrE